MLGVSSDDLARSYLHLAFVISSAIDLFHLSSYPLVDVFQLALFNYMEVFGDWHVGGPLIHYRVGTFLSLNKFANCFIHEVIRDVEIGGQAVEDLWQAQKYRSLEILATLLLLGLYRIIKELVKVRVLNLQLRFDVEIEVCLVLHVCIEPRCHRLLAIFLLIILNNLLAGQQLQRK